ncbi:MAG: ABC transporter permease, partial [Caldilineaceae bacterium SB0666_bin_21]|nr:ABC transporter permease [Caldilineaceae bacterium SB0666_bin_21]
MIFGEIIRIALRALTVNKLRSLLTMLGIISGISTATVLISAGQAVERYIYDLFAGIGTNVLFVVPGQLTENQDPTAEPRFGELTLSDARALSNP